MSSAPLSGLRIVVTREHRGELDRRLAELGADVVHVALIETADPADGGSALADALSRLADYDWLVVTSPNGARRVAGAVAALPILATAVACVGEATADLMRAVGCEPQLVPAVARLDGLLDVFPQGPGCVLVARADLADPRLVTGLRRRGWAVDDVVAYRTLERRPTPHDRAAVAGADAVVLASGSAARAWASAFGTGSTAAIITIGPSTAAVASEVGLPVAATAANQSIDGIIAELVSRWGVTA
ncbi:hypothetical protein BH20ACT4_BH20ACT4_14310 [soil metagenome]